ncbi:hypothetical protein [Planomonospora sp. ID82291]|uniref:hypothetical protein n=1 Tax=Planomonospora sp. ID82291 TaxID=2738136 RepID=UPI0018C3E866|nr:hypothetical protein [Planomonospora sp. ID82291]MBG0818455.1 hypothetical protein [Planomonospora sp. ID82291]
MLNPALTLRSALSDLLTHLDGSAPCGPGCISSQRPGPSVGDAHITCTAYAGAVTALAKARSARASVTLPLPTRTATYGNPVDTGLGRLAVHDGQVQLSIVCSSCDHIEARTTYPETAQLIAAVLADAAERALDPDPAEVQRLVNDTRPHLHLPEGHDLPSYADTVAVITALLRGHRVTTRAATPPSAGPPAEA